MEPADRPLRVAAALSGGVDSTVAALCAVAAGHEVTGVTLLLWGGDRVGRSCSTADATAAAAAAAAIGIDHVVLDHRDDFERRVVEPFAADAAAGKTSNPCVECNRAFKLDGLHAWASANGYDAVVTGHHARVVTVDGARRLARSVDRGKDQSYVLYTASAEQLACLLLPLGELTKADVRRIAADHGLDVASAPDSMDLCFDRGSIVGATAADVVSSAGDVVGAVDALELVTVGQRRGLGISPAAVGREPSYVIAVDAVRRQVRLGTAADLLTSEVTLHVDAAARAAVGQRVDAQSSAHGVPEPAQVAAMADGTVTVRFGRPVRRTAPGQHVVLYVDDVVVGGGQVA